MENNIGLLTITSALLLALNQCTGTHHTQLQHPTFIAHGGGGYQGESVTNSLEALNHNYTLGHRFFEVDFCWTSDHHLVLIHDWGHSYKRLFYDEENLPLMKQYLSSEGLHVLRENPMEALRRVLQENPKLGQPNLLQPPLYIFLSLSMFSNFTQLSFDHLAQWLVRHPDAYIVTDIKEDDNVAGLAYMKKRTQRYHVPLTQIIPQVYKFSEYTRAMEMGYPNIIFTKYRSVYSDEEIVEFAHENRPFAVTLPFQHILATDLGNRLRQDDIFVYLHTVNDTRLIKRLKDRGAKGFYTDWLVETSDSW